jgi:NADPH:quinone reductase-like Zn-dependent oxidoreductase
MKAARIYTYGDSENIKIEDINIPTPAPNEVLVKIFDAGVNPVDWKIREGYMKHLGKTAFPMTLGQDFAGEVSEIGTKVHDFKVGERIFGFASGSYAEYATVSVDRIALIPHSMDYETAAALPTVGLTAYQMIVKEAKIGKNQIVLVHGGGGGVGSLAVQFAHWRGAQVYATASAIDLPYVESLGVLKAIDYRTQRFEDFVSNADVVVDLVGGETQARSLKILKQDGLLISSVGVSKDNSMAGHNRTMSFVMQPNTKDLAEVARLVEKKVVQLRVGEVLPLSEAKLAQDLNQKEHGHGKIVLEVFH